MNKQSSKKRPITQDDIHQAKYICDGDLSADGKLAVYVQSETVGSGKKERQETAIWVVGTDGTGARRITRGKGSSYNPRFLANNNEIVFLSSRDKVPQIYRLSLDGGEAQAVTALAQGVSSFTLSDNRKALAFVASAVAPKEADKDSHVRIDRPWYRFDPLPGYLQDVELGIHYMASVSARPRQIGKVNAPVSAMALSPDNKQLAFLLTADRGHEFIESDLCLLATSGRAQEPIVLLRKATMFDVLWNAAGDALICSGPEDGLASQSGLYKTSLSSGKSVSRTRKLDIMVGVGVSIHSRSRVNSSVERSTDSNAVYSAVTRGGEVNLHKITLGGKQQATPITSGARVCHLLSSNHSKLLFTSQDPNNPARLHLLDLESGRETVLTDQNKKWREALLWPELKRITVTSEKNVEIEGWVLIPRHKRRPHKTILVIHGGPHAGYGYGFSFDFQELVGAGYAVAFANPRGSTGYGQEFTRAILGCWGDPEFKDFNAFLDELIRLKISDKDKLGVTGISGGGHLSGWLIGHTNRFKAAVPEQGVYSMISMWGTSDAGKELIELELAGKPHKMPLTYWQRSPVAYAHRCKTPTLLIQGEDDVRCPMEQAEQMYAALEYHGCEVELIRLQGCSHGEQVGGRPQLARFRMDALKDWFGRYLP